MVACTLKEALIVEGLAKRRQTPVCWKLALGGHLSAPVLGLLDLTQLLNSRLRASKGANTNPLACSLCPARACLLTLGMARFAAAAATGWRVQQGLTLASFSREALVGEGLSLGALAGRGVPFAPAPIPL